MKFSWKLLNNIINLKQIKINELINKLILSGIEVEKIEENKDLKDKSIDLSITSNRKEISSTINLAREISSIFNISIKNRPIYFQRKLYQQNKNNLSINLSEHIAYISINIITNTKNSELPKWITNYLEICEIKHKKNKSYFLENIQKYIELKWGHTFYILDKINLQKQLIYLNISSINDDFLQKLNRYLHNKYKIIVFIIYKNDKIMKNFNSLSHYNDIDYFTNAYYETINLITTFTQSTISRSYEGNNYIKIYNRKINTSKLKIHQILGPIINKKFKYISKKEILHILRKLNFSPKYQVNQKIFILNIPKYRYHDLKREIDIIEEIGRIYGFKSFFDNLKDNKKQGKISNITLHIKKIRLLLRNLGFNEVINCSLVNYTDESKKNNQIYIYNPITKEQSKLRNNLLSILIENYNNNHKHNNFRTEIFEIGKIFEKNINNQYIENKHLGGLIQNQNFIRKTWYDKPEEINWFHAKGTIEIFLEQLNASIIWKQIDTKETNQFLRNIKKFIHPKNNVGIYSQFNQKLIGVLGELNPIYNINNIKRKIYLFEIKINELYRTNIKNTHLKYNFKEYSNYPKVTRDISIETSKDKSINQIKSIIIQTNKELIESIDVFNDYYNKKLNSRFIGLRITYRTNHRTLNNKDINHIDLSIKNLLKKLQKIR